MSAHEQQCTWPVGDCQCAVPAPSAEPKCNRCDDTGCPECDPEWAQHQRPAQAAPDADGPTKDANGHTPVSARSVGLDREWVICEDCGLIQPKTGFSKPCRGPTSVQLRDKQAAPDADDLTRRLRIPLVFDVSPTFMRENLALSNKDRANAADLIEHQARELADAKADAERYRWLRDHMTHEQCGPSVGWTIGELLPGDDPDAAIDAAKGAK